MLKIQTEIKKITDQYVYITMPKDNIVITPQQTAIFIPENIWELVENILYPQMSFLKELLECEEIPGTKVYYEKNWHDRLVKEIMDLTGEKDRIDISNAVSAIVEED